MQDSRNFSRFRNFASEIFSASMGAYSGISALRGVPRPLFPLQRFNSLPSFYHVRQLHLAWDVPAVSSSLAPGFPTPRFALPTLSSIIPIITGIWDSILRAVPKKKTSYSRKRKRQLCGKGLKDKTNLHRCEACGDWKLLHTLCMSCVKSIQNDWRRRERLAP